MKKMFAGICLILVLCPIVKYTLTFAAGPKDEMCVYVKTLGEAVSCSSAVYDKEVGLQESTDAGNILSDFIMSQQNHEKTVEMLAVVHKPEEKVNGLVTRYRQKLKLTKAEYEIMYRIVEAEAGGENISGRMLVANVIINRMKSKHFPDSVRGVVFAHSGRTYQFSPISDGRYYTVKISDITKKAVKRAVGGEDNSRGAEYFVCRSLADSGNVRWFDNCLEYLFSYGCHEFFKR